MAPRSLHKARVRPQPLSNVRQHPRGGRTRATTGGPRTAPSQRSGARWGVPSRTRKQRRHTGQAALSLRRRCGEAKQRPRLPGPRTKQERGSEGRRRQPRSRGGGPSARPWMLSCRPQEATPACLARRALGDGTTAWAQRWAPRALSPQPPPRVQHLPPRRRRAARRRCEGLCSLRDRRSPTCDVLRLLLLAQAPTGRASAGEGAMRAALRRRRDRPTGAGGRWQAWDAWGVDRQQAQAATLCTQSTARAPISAARARHQPRRSSRRRRVHTSPRRGATAEREGASAGDGSGAPRQPGDGGTQPSVTLRRVGPSPPGQRTREVAAATQELAACRSGPGT